MPTKILIHGAGAIGAFYASRLSLVPTTEVSVICRSSYPSVSKHGFKITSPKYGTYNFNPHQTFPSPQQARVYTREENIHWDYVLICTKALAPIDDGEEEDVSSVLEGIVGPQTAIVIIQNGIGVEEIWWKRFGKLKRARAILSAVTICSSEQVLPGIIKHNRWTRISIGAYLPDSDIEDQRKMDAEQANEVLVRLLKDGGIQDAEFYTPLKLQIVRWHKLAINASMNPSSVLSGCSTNSAMSHDPELSIHLIGAMNEIIQCGCKKLGIKEMPGELASVEKIMESTRRNDSGSRPSMAIDWENGRDMEFEVIIGEAVRMGRELGVCMPRCQSMFALISMLQRNRKWVEEQSAKGDGRSVSKL